MNVRESSKRISNGVKRGFISESEIGLIIELFFCRWAALPGYFRRLYESREIIQS
jgi:hypothetical protein